MALDVRKLTKGLANIRNEKTAKNKWLKTKPKMREMRDNVKDATKIAHAHHTYLQDLSVGFDPAGVIPPFEKDSFKPLVEKISSELALVGAGDQSTLVTKREVTVAATNISTFTTQMEIGIVTTNDGARYLTTRARGAQLGRWVPMTAALAKTLSTLEGGVG